MTPWNLLGIACGTWAGPLRRVEHAEPSAGAGAEVEQSPAARKRVGDEFDRAGDVRPFATDRFDCDRVLAVHQGDGILTLIASRFIDSGRRCSVRMWERSEVTGGMIRDGLGFQL